MAAAIAAQIAAGNTPDAILIPHNHDGRDIAARLSVKIDRPVLTNVIGLEDRDGLVTEHSIFGGSQMLTARFTDDGPGIFVVRERTRSRLRTAVAYRLRSTPGKCPTSERPTAP